MGSTTSYPQECSTVCIAIKYSSASQPQLIEIPFCLYNNIETVDFSYDGNEADENN
jgi:hypothetical protein